MPLVFVLLLFLLPGCIFEAPCAFCSVEFRGTIDNLDSNQDLKTSNSTQCPHSWYVDFDNLSNKPQLDIKMAQ